MNDGDCVLIATAPVHVPVVENSLATSVLSSLPVVRLFIETPIGIRMILETQPRSGTGIPYEIFRNHTVVDMPPLSEWKTVKRHRMD